MQHCRLLFETLCRWVKPFLLFLLRSLGTVPSLSTRLLPFPCASHSSCCLGRVGMQQHMSVGQAPGCETCQAVQVLPLCSSLPDELLGVKRVQNHHLHHYLQGISLCHKAISLKYFMFQSTDLFQSRILWFHTDEYPLLSTTEDTSETG